LLVRGYVQDKVGSSYLNEIYWAGSDPNKIPFEILPSRCVFKTNHGSGGNLILKHPYDRIEIVKILRKWLNENYYWSGREYQYFNIKPKVLVEAYIDDGFSGGGR
jgi:hypothetical protein